MNEGFCDDDVDEPLPKFHAQDEIVPALAEAVPVNTVAVPAQTEVAVKDVVTEETFTTIGVRVVPGQVET